MNCEKQNRIHGFCSKIKYHHRWWGFRRENQREKKNSRPINKPKLF